MKKLIVFLIIGFSSQYAGGNKQEEFCMTSQCIKEAANIQNSLDKHINPCEDFYRFACGNAIKKIVIPKTKSYIDQFDIITDKIAEQLRAILEEPIKQDDIRPITLVKKYYQACIDEDYIEKQGKQVILDLLKELGGWPVLEGDSWNEDSFSWTQLVYKFREKGLGTSNFIEFTVDPSPDNSSIRIAELDQATFGLQRERLTTGTHTNTYLELMVNIAVELGADRTKAEKELKDSLNLEIELAKIALPVEERTNITLLNNPFTINELQVKYPKIPWLEYINKLLPSAVQLQESDVVLIVVPKYFIDFEELMSKTPKRVQANYAMWRLVQDLTSYLPKTIYQHFQNAVSKIDGQTKRDDRWKECSQTTYNRLPLLVSSLYVRKYFDKDAKSNALEITKYLENAFKEILKKLDWMDEATRQKALTKAETIVKHIGFPNELLDDKLLENHYEKLEIDAHQYLHSHLNISRHQTDFNFKRLPEIVDKLDWTNHGSVASVGASYRLQENSIFFTAGILQGTFFNKERPRYMNYGAIGSIIGHEITHGFDNVGRQFDENGNLVSWWAAETEKSFLDKTQCMIHQYGNYTVPVIKTNISGIRTQGENIADNGGLKEAYAAYNEWVKDNGTPELKLPGLEYSPHQLFWISAAMNWCASYTPESIKNIVAIDTHSPTEFRVTGPFSNSKDFASDFNCPSGSKMNPEHKCAVW